MKFDKPSGGSPVRASGKFDDGTTEIERANARMISENPEAYAEWRIRMGLEQKPEPRDNPAMRARIARLFAELGKGLELPRSRRRPNYLPIEELADYAASPLTVSDEMAELLHAGEF